MRGQTHCTIFSTGLLREGPNTLHDFQHQCHTWLEPVLSPNVSSNPHLRCIGHDTPSNGGSSTCLKETPDPAQQNQRGIARPTPPLSLSACIGPARIGISRPTSPLSLGLHRPGPHRHRPAGPHGLSLGPRPLRRTTEDHEFIGSDIDQSTQLGNKL